MSFAAWYSATVWGLLASATVGIGSVVGRALKGRAGGGERLIWEAAIGCVAATFALGASASSFAADPGCGAVPTAPTVPDAATAKPADVNAVGKSIETYANEMDKWQSCMGKYIDTEIKKSNDTIDGYTKLVADVKARTAPKK